MRERKWLPWGASIAAALVAGVLATQPGRSQSDGAGGSQIAISNSVNNHTHTFGLQTQDVAALAAGLQNENDAIVLRSSEAPDGGTINGTVHSHAITLRKSQLQQLMSGATVTVQSEEAQGHSHVFQFVNNEQCPAAGQAMPLVPLVPTGSPTVGPSGSPSPSPSPSASPSASPSPSGSPSSAPSSAPSTTPTGTATPIRTLGPIAPLTTFTPGPIVTLNPIAPRIAPIAASAPVLNPSP